MQNRTYYQDDKTISIHQWNQKLIRAEKLASGRIIITKSIEALVPNDFAILHYWAINDAARLNAAMNPPSTILNEKPTLNTQNKLDQYEFLPENRDQ